jgi:hypothetical protein
MNATNALHGAAAVLTISAGCAARDWVVAVDGLVGGDSASDMLMSSVLI